MNSTKHNLADEKTLSHLIENITYEDLDMKEYLYFSSDDALKMHIEITAKKIYPDSTNGYISNQLQFHIKQRIAEIIALDVKNAEVRPKLMPKNLLLLEVMYLLNQPEDENVVRVLNNSGKEVIKSDEIYKIKTDIINEKLANFFFKDRELDIRVKHKNFKFLANRDKASSETKLSILRKRYISKLKKLIKLRKELISFRDEIKLANQAFRKDTKKFKGQEKRVLKRSRLSELRKNKTQYKKLQEEIIKKYIFLRQEYQTNLKTVTEKLKEALSKINQFETLEIEMNSEIKKLHQQKDKFCQKIENNNTQYESSDYCTFLIGEHLLTSKIALADPLCKGLTVAGLKKNKRDLIDDCLHYLRAYNLITQIKYDQGFNLNNDYTFNIDSWLNRQKHPINDTNVINTLIPLLIAYLKLQNTNRVDDFLSHIDALTAYSSQAPEDFSDSKTIESNIVHALRKKSHINIGLVEGRVFTSVSEFDLDIEATTNNKVLNWTADTDFKVRVKDIAELFYDNGKNKIHLNNRKQLLKEAIKNKETITIVFKPDGQSEDITYVSTSITIVSDKSEDQDKTPDEVIIGWSESFHTRKLSLIESIQIENRKTSPEEADDTSDLIGKQTSGFAINQEKYNIPDRKYHNIILEADTNLVDFFNIKPLKNQVIYKTKSEKEQFCKDFGIEVLAKSKIYITAKDQTDAVLHVVKRCIPAVKILEPTVIKNEFRDIIKSMCDKM